MYREIDSDEVEQVPNDSAVETGYSEYVFRDHTAPAPFVRQL